MTFRQFVARYGAWSWILGYDSIMAGAFFFFLGHTIILQIIWATIGIALTSGKVSAFVEAQAEKADMMRRRLLYMTWGTIMIVTTFAAMNFSLAISEAQANESKVSSALTEAKNTALLATIDSLTSQQKTLTDQLSALAEEQKKTPADYKGPQERISANILTATKSLNDVTQKLADISKNGASEVNLSSDKMFSQITGENVSRLIEVIFFVLISLGCELVLALFAPRKSVAADVPVKRTYIKREPTLAKLIERWVIPNWISVKNPSVPEKKILTQDEFMKFWSDRNEDFPLDLYEKLKAAALKIGALMGDMIHMQDVKQVVKKIKQEMIG